MDPKEFLTSLWGKTPPGQVLIWTAPSKKSIWVTRFDRVNREVQELAQSEDVYTGVGLASASAGTPGGKRVKAHNVSGIAGLWADIDIAHPVHQKENLPPDMTTALDLLDNLFYEPTLVVNSGHGVQAWWLFSEPWIFDGPEDRAEAQRLSQWWHREHVERAMRQEGYAVDPVHDLSRLLRIPGTMNHKETEPVPVEVMEGMTDGPRADYREFLDGIPREFRAATPARSGNTGRENPEQGELLLNPDAEPPALKLTTMLEIDDNFRRSWERRRKNMNDTSPSAYDMSLARLAASEGWQDQEIVDLLIAWRRKHGIEAKLRQSYYRVTLASAREPIIKERAEEKLYNALNNVNQEPEEDSGSGAAPSERAPPEGESGTEGEGMDDQQTARNTGQDAAQDTGQDAGQHEGRRPAGEADPPDGGGGPPWNGTGNGNGNGDGEEEENPGGEEEDRRRIREALSGAMGIQILRLIKYKGDPPQYWMSTEDGDITLGTANNLMNQTTFRAAIFGATNTAVPGCKKPEWDRRVAALGRICEEVDVGEASRPVDETMEWLDRYMTENTATDKLDQAAIALSPFIHKGTVHFFSDDFRKWVESHPGVKLSPHQMGQRLRQCGWHTEAINFNINDKAANSRRSTRTCWTRAIPANGTAQPWETVMEAARNDGDEDGQDDGKDGSQDPGGDNGQAQNGEKPK